MKYAVIAAFPVACLITLALLVKPLSRGPVTAPEVWLAISALVGSLWIGLRGLLTLRGPLQNVAGLTAGIAGLSLLGVIVDWLMHV